MSPLVRYIIFAFLSTLVNLGVQYLSEMLYQGQFHLYVAMIAGTGSGFVLKYLLDKYFVFNYSATSKSEEAKTVFLYGLMAIVTTIIFWGSELLFDTMIEAEWGKYLGAVIGLTIGYITKYFLDKRFVFKTNPQVR